MESVNKFSGAGSRVRRPLDFEIYPFLRGGWTEIRGVDVVVRVNYGSDFHDGDVIRHSFGCG
jgi:hypothetical protein